MSKVTIWHNPRCTKSRQTFALLAGHDVTERRYLDDAPSADEIRQVLDLLGIPASDLVRRGEAEFKAAGLTKDSDEATLITAMTAHPKLIQRPVVLANGKAAIGRPPEAALKILD